MRDLTPVLDVLAVAETAPDADALRRGVVDALAGLLPCEHVVWGELDVVRMEPVAAVASDGTAIDLAAFGRHVATHPLIAHHLHTGDPGPLRLSDFVSARRLHALGVYADFYAPLGVDRALCVALAPVAGRATGVAFHRAGRDFAEDERTLLARIRPALSVATRRAAAVTGVRAPLTDREAQVIGLIERGATNAEVGLTLHISRRTVEKHLEHAYRKLGVAGRYAAIASARSSSTSP
jgi:DNA-binding CsgD family transcriptional regulator